MQKTFNINPNKPTEELNAVNMYGVKIRVGGIHVSKSYLYVCRKLIGSMKNFWKADKALRRGIIKAILETHQANRDLYYMVMSGNF